MQNDFEHHLEPPAGEASNAGILQTEAGQALNSPTGQAGSAPGSRAFPRGFKASTFSSGFLPSSLSRPTFGYLFAIVGQLVAAGLIALITLAFPRFQFPESLVLFVVLLVALGWGVGPSIVATITGAVLLVLLVIPPFFSLAVAHVEDLAGIVLFVCVGFIVSILASQVQRAYYRAQTLSARLETIIEAIPDAVVIYDQRGMSRQWNPAAKGAGRDNSLEVPLTNMPEQLDLRNLQGERLSLEELPLARALRGEIVRNGEMAFKTVVERQDRFVSVSAAPLRDPRSGAIEGAVTITHDLSLLWQAQRRTAERSHQLEAVFESITDAFFILDVNGAAPRLNAAARELLGLAPGEQIDPMQPLPFELLDESGNPLPYEQWPESRLRKGERLHGADTPDVLLRVRSGRISYMSVSGAPMYDANGKLSGVVLICHDVTERRRIEEALRASESRFRLLAENAQDVIYRYRLTPTFAYDYISPSVYKVTGYTAEEFYADPDLALNIVHPDDRHLLRGQRQYSGISEAISFRWIHKDGKIIWLELQGKSFFDDEGNIVVVEGIARDITERKRLQEAELASARMIAEQAGQLEAVFESITDQLLVYNKEAQLVRVNEASRRFDALISDPQQRALPVRKRISGYFVRDEQDQLLTAEQIPIFRILQGQVLTSDNAEDVRLTLPEGRSVQLSVTGAPIRDAQGELVGGVLVCRDVTERRLLEQRTRATLDALLEIAQVLVQKPYQASWTGNQELAVARRN